MKSVVADERPRPRAFIGPHRMPKNLFAKLMDPAIGTRYPMPDRPTQYRWKGVPFWQEVHEHKTPKGVRMDYIMTCNDDTWSITISVFYRRPVGNCTMIRETKFRGSENRFQQDIVLAQIAI